MLKPLLILDWWKMCHRCLMILFCFLQHRCPRYSEYFVNLHDTIISTMLYPLHLNNHLIASNENCWESRLHQCLINAVHIWRRSTEGCGDTFVKETGTREPLSLLKARGLVRVSCFQLIRMFLNLLSAQKLLSIFECLQHAYQVSAKPEV